MVEKNSEYNGIGSPKYLGRCIRALRQCYENSPQMPIKDFPNALGVDRNVYYMLEKGEASIPPQEELVAMLSRANLHPEEIIDLQLAAGYIPLEDLKEGLSLTTIPRHVFVEAWRSFISENRSGFRGIFQASYSSLRAFIPNIFRR